MFFRRRKGSPGCTSAGRITAQLLLSFLAVSATPAYAASNSRVDEQLVIPYDPIPITPLKPEAPSPGEHKFVSISSSQSVAME